MFDSSFLFFSILLVAAVGLSLLMTSKQLTSIYQLRKKCSKEYTYVSLGKGSKKTISVLVLVCADDELNILKAYRMRGLTVFDRMRPFPLLEGINVRSIRREDDLPASMSHRTRLAIVSACEYILEAQKKQDKAEFVALPQSTQ